MNPKELELMEGRQYLDFFLGVKFPYVAQLHWLRFVKLWRVWHALFDVKLV